MALLRACMLWPLLAAVQAKWIEGRIDTKDNWAFLARFCFLSLEGQFEYLIEYDKDMGTPNLLLYYDDDSQWPSVYHSSKTCKEREAVLNKAGQNQIIKLSHWFPDTEYSGCIVTKESKELPAEKSSSTTPKPTKTTARPKNTTNTTSEPSDPTYYNQFLKTTMASTTVSDNSTISTNSTTWFEVVPTDGFFTTTVAEDELWESIGGENDTKMEKLNDVEMMFDNDNSKHKIKRSTSELLDRYRRRRLNSVPNQPGQGSVERLLVSCHNSRRFRSARERWWFIAISNCDSPKGLDIRYKFLMTNGPDGDFWHEHFSADEFYVLPVLLAYTFAYFIVMVAVVLCSIELKSRHLLHSTYKLFLLSVTAQQVGVIIQTLAYIRYATHGFGGDGARVVGQFLCGISETTFLLLLVLLGKGYTVTRGRLKAGFTVRLTVFMCCYVLAYIGLFIYQAKAFDPGEVLYLYESPAGYGLIVLRVAASCVFAYSVFFTVRKYPEKNMFYCPFFICGTLWFYAGPLFILTANAYIDKWVRESVVTAVLLLISFNGHVMFLLLTLPVFANKNFPYHVRTTQIGVMEVTGSSGLDGFGHNAYHPSNGTAQTVIIPLTRRTEELIGNMYSQYMATAPPLDTPLNGVKRINSLSPKNQLVQQDSTDTNTSDDIKPVVNEIFTVENQMSKLELPEDKNNVPNPVLPQESVEKLPKMPHESDIGNGGPRNELPSVLRSRRNILEPLKRDDVPVPSWSLAKGPSVIAMHKKNSKEDPPEPVANGKKVPPVRNGLHQSSGAISTIHEGREQSYPPPSTLQLFNAKQESGG
ncbi:transmembrane protein 145-like [Cydia splendana]|uniref:transmembrane protein 145-like n=1 Tax=Cydia splendana TaxID=1100963 RepID=UPI00300D16B7